MTEIPEHLRKRAEEARAKAAAASGASRGARRAREPAAAEPAAPAAPSEPAASSPDESRIPAHLLERSKAARAEVRGCTADRGRGARGVAAATATTCGRDRSAARRRGSGRSHAAAADRRQGRLDPGREGDSGRQGPRLAAPAAHRVRRLARVHCVRVRLLGVRERAAAAAREHQPHAEPVEGTVVLPRVAGAAHDVPSDGRRA